MFYNSFLMWLIVLILINIRRSNNSLMSRYRNPNEYVLRDDEKYLFPEDIEDNLYADLLEEVPELAGRLRFYPTDVKKSIFLPFIRKEENGSIQRIPYDENINTEKDEDQEEYSGQLVQQGPKISSSTTRQLPFLTWRTLNGSDEWARRQHLKMKGLPNDGYDSSREGLIARCYWCGMNHSTKIPMNSLCHDAFESQDWRTRTLYRYFRAHCYTRPDSRSDIKRYYYSKNISYHNDNGLIRRQYAMFTGGCFKRFLDVGKVYTQRGCRKDWPVDSVTPNFVTHRFRRMEALIFHEKEFCLTSPQASLTPFSRSISLYVRYHVCVCSGRYCNNTIRSQDPLSLITSLILVFNFMIF